MSRSMVGLLAAVGAAMCALVGLTSLGESTLGTDTPTFTKPVTAKATAAPAALTVTLAEVESDLTQIEGYVKAHPQ
jgi:hypothetical protein